MGEWLPMQTDLHQHQATLSIADATGLDPDAVVGKLLRVWGWARERTTNGKVLGAAPSFLDRLTGVSGFGSAMLKATGDGGKPWLESGDGFITFPKWDKWLSNGAKQRAKDQARKRRERDGQNADKTGTQSGQNADRKRTPLGTNSVPQREQRSREQTENKTMLKSNAPLPEFSVGDDACSLLRTIGMDDGAIRYLTSLAGVDDGQVYWACERTRAAMVKARKQGGKPVKNPAAYCRNLIERKRPPQGWRDEWNRKRMAEQASKVGGLKLAGGVA